MFDPRPTSSEAWNGRLVAAAVIAVLLAAVDQWVTRTVATPPWAIHQRSGLWFGTSLLLLFAVVPLTRVPSRAVAIAAGIFAGGVLGNLISASFDGLSVPNPIIIVNGMNSVAFNPADTFILAGNLALMTTLIRSVFRHRHELKAWRAERRDVLRRRLDSSG